MKYSITLMNSRGKEVKIPTAGTQSSVGLAIAYAHKHLLVDKQFTRAVIREVYLDKPNKVVKVVSLSDRHTTVLK